MYHLTSTLKRGILAGVIALSAVVAVVAVNRANPAAEPAPATLAGNPEPVARDVQSSGRYSEPPTGQPVPAVYAASPFGSPAVAPVAARAPEVATAPVAPPAMAEASAAPVVQNAYYRRTRTRSHRYYRASRAYRPRTRVVVRRRPFSHSAAIVGGSAAGGAAIGALAGGGKGAAAGALVGGAGGFIYDRLTHKKRYVVTR